MKAGSRVRVLHAHAWIATKLIGAYAPFTRTRGLKENRQRHVRVSHAYAWVHLRPRYKIGTTLAQLSGKWLGIGCSTIGAPAHITRTRGWRFLEDRRVRARYAHAQGVILLKIF